MLLRVPLAFWMCSKPFFAIRAITLDKIGNQI
jgi:hypothetical protein